MISESRLKNYEDANCKGQGGGPQLSLSTGPGMIPAKDDPNGVVRRAWFFFDKKCKHETKPTTRTKSAGKDQTRLVKCGSARQRLRFGYHCQIDTSVHELISQPRVHGFLAICRTRLSICTNQGIAFVTISWSKATQEWVLTILIGAVLICSVKLRAAKQNRYADRTKPFLFQP